MIPIADRVLSLAWIAQYSSRELHQLRTSDEIFDELISAFWQGRLDVTGPSGSNKVDRLAILKIVNRQRQHPGFTLVESTEEQTPVAEPMPNGSIRVDLTYYVFLPSDEAAWTEEVIEAAFARLATRSFDDFDALIRPGLNALSSTREMLRTYCAAMGYDLPHFWFGTERRGQWNIRREKDARAWFKRIAVGPKKQPKPQYFTDARKEFPGISRDAFDRIWEELAPPIWKQSGPVIRTPGVQSSQ
jgi:hypothetical protein